MDKLGIFFQLSKVDLVQRTVEGIATAELPDKTNEVCDYESTKPYYEKWSDGIKKATGGKSLGNVRAMHGNVAAGKVTDLQFDDVQKAIRIVAKIVDDAEWNKVVEGVYTGFSQGGEYVKRWKDGDVTKYTANPSEVSIVDNPCLGAATFECVKADGTTEMRKFHTPVEPNVSRGTMQPVQKWETTDGKTFAKKADAEAHQGSIDAETFAQQVIARVKKVASNIEGKLEDHENKSGVEKKPDEPKVDPKAEEGEEHKKAWGAIGTLAKHELFDANLAIDALCQIEWVLANELMEEANGKDEAAQIEDLKACIERLKSFITSEIEEAASVEKVLGQAVMKASGMHEEHAQAVSEIHGHAHQIMDHIHKALHGHGGVSKAEHHNDHDQHHVEQAHEQASMIADKCMKMVDGAAPAMSDDHKKSVHEIHKSATNVMDAAHKFLHGSSEKAIHHDAHDRSQLHKMHSNAKDIVDKCVGMFGAHDQEKVTKLTKAADEALAQRDALVKAVNELTPQFEEMQKRIDHLERQPAPRKGVLHAVDQGRHEVPSGDEPVETVSKVNISSLRLSPEELRSVQSSI